MKRPAFIYSDKFQDYDYGGGHPLRMIRLKLTCELLRSCGAFGQGKAELVEAEPCTFEEATTVHSTDYVRALRSVDEGAEPAELGRYGLGHGDNPVFRGVYAGSALATGASLMAARLVQGGGHKAAFNIAGGLHHAMRSYASGFCYINDPAVAIFELAQKGLKVAYVDIDAHHGDGVQAMFYDTDQVLTISIHESGTFLFPGTGSTDETGMGKGRGYSVNLPLYPGTGDDVFAWGFSQLVPPLVHAFGPDVIVTQLGCDTLESDPLTHLRLTTNGFERMVRGFKELGLPWVALGGGGYDVANVARAWSIAFCVMSDIELPVELPESYRALLKEEGLSGRYVRDTEPTRETAGELKAERDYAEKALIRLKRDVFPVHGIKT